MTAKFAVDESLLREARAITGIAEDGALVEAALEALIAREAARRLAARAGTQRDLRTPRRRRTRPAS